MKLPGIAVVRRHIRRGLLILLPSMGLAGCIDGPTNRWVDPVTFSAIVVRGVATSRPAPPPPAEWTALCREGLEGRWDGPRPAPAALGLGGGPALVALALRRTGASQAVIHVPNADGGWFAPVITKPGIYRIGIRDAAEDCGRRLDVVIRRWSQQGDAWAKARSCLVVERLGDHVALDVRRGSPEAPYFVKSLNSERTLDGGFTLRQSGAALIEQSTGREIYRRTLWASLYWATPDLDHHYRGSVRSCGSGRDGVRWTGILGERLFAGG